MNSHLIKALFQATLHLPNISSTFVVGQMSKLLKQAFTRLTREPLKVLIFMVGHITTKIIIIFQDGTSSSLNLIANNLAKEVTNGRQEQGVDEVEFMSSSSSSSSSDSP